MPVARRLKLLRPLRVDIDALERAWDDDEGEGTHFLDLVGGDVVFVGGGDRMAMKRIERDPGRWLPVPTDPPGELGDDMAAYVGEVEDPKLRRRLRDALKAKDAARRFHGVLWDDDTLDEWAVFQHGRLRARIVDWLAAQGLAAVFEER